MPTLHRQVLNQMGEQICAGKFSPGDTLPAESELAELMKVSRITIRETMKSLSAKGMLQVRRRHGTIVRRARTGNSSIPTSSPGAHAPAWSIATSSGT